jgi:hypothetical protein
MDLDLILFLMSLLPRSLLRCITSHLSIRSSPPPLPLDILGQITCFLDTVPEKLNLCLAVRHFHVISFLF